MSEFNYDTNSASNMLPSNRKSVCDTCHWQRDQIFKSKSVLKKRKTIVRDSNSMYFWCITIVLITLPYLSECQMYPTRDPRWYSREGDYNYLWPNPGDSDYR